MSGALSRAMATHRQSALAALRAVATECQALAASFSDEQTTEGLILADGMCAVFQRPAAAAAVAGSAGGSAAQLLEFLSVVPHELLIIIMSQLRTRDVACLAAASRSLWFEPADGLVETELRRRAEARGLHIGSALPEGTLTWVPYLLKRDYHRRLRREAPLAVGNERSLFVDWEGHLRLSCRRDKIAAREVGEPLMGHDWSWCTGDSVPPTLVPTIPGTRFLSVATGDRHCLALSGEGEVYSWGDNTHAVLGHVDGMPVRAGPRKIDTLAHIESIAAGPDYTCAVVDDRGRLFTWGQTRAFEYDDDDEPLNPPFGLGYWLHPETEFQESPKWVDALSEYRVVGVALGVDFTLAVTDLGAVFSFGSSGFGALGHGSLKSEVLPRRIEALTQTRRRFVAVAAGDFHALALTEEGEVYGWGNGSANGSATSEGENQYTPQRVTALASERVLLLHARSTSSCAVIENGGLFTWGRGAFNSFNLGHGVVTPQQTPKRVEALRRVHITAAAICNSHTLVADSDGAVWCFGQEFGVGEEFAPPGGLVEPTPIPTLRVRTLP